MSTTHTIAQLRSLFPQLPDVAIALLAIAVTHATGSSSAPIEQDREIRSRIPPPPPPPPPSPARVHSDDRATPDREALMRSIRQVRQSNLRSITASGDPNLVASTAGAVRHEVSCDMCRNEIVGIRYKCFECADYNLCSACEERNLPGAYHAADHAFLKLRRPWNGPSTKAPERVPSAELERLHAGLDSLQRQVAEIRQRIQAPPPPPLPPPPPRRPVIASRARESATQASKPRMPYTEQLLQLQRLGADFYEARVALLTTNGNLDSAIDLLFP